MPQELDPSQQYDLAVESGDPNQMVSVAQQNPNTPVAIAAIHASDLMYKGQKAFEDMTAPVEKAGGLGTPEGNIAAAKQANKYFRQEDPRMKDAFIYWLTGNNKMAQAMITGGDITWHTKSDKDGRIVQYATNQLGKIVDAEDENGQRMDRKQFQDRQVGLQQYENTLSYLAKKEINKNNTDEWQAKIKRDSQAEQVYRTQIEPLAKRTLEDLNFVQNLDIDPKKRAELIKTINYSISQGSRSSSSETSLKQAQATANMKAGQELSKEESAAWGVPPGVYKWTKSGIEKKTGGESYSFDRLNQLSNTADVSNEIDNRTNTDRESMIKYLRTANLNKEQQDRVLRIYDSSKELGNSILKIHNNPDAPKFLYTPNVTDSDDPYALVQGKMIQLLTNGNLIRLQSEYAKNAYDRAVQRGGILPNPFEIEKGFSRSAEARNEIEQGMMKTDELISRATQQAPNQKRAGAIAPPAQAAVVGPAGAVAPVARTENREVAMPSVQSEAEATRARLLNQGAPMNPPEGMVFSGKYDKKTGKPIWIPRGQQ